MVLSTVSVQRQCSSFFFFNDTATTEIYTLSLHDALPIYAFARHRELLADFLQRVVGVHADAKAHAQHALLARRQAREQDRKSTRLNSSHLVISYAVFCLKKKKSTDSPLRSVPLYSSTRTI